MEGEGDSNVNGCDVIWDVRVTVHDVSLRHLADPTVWATANGYGQLVISGLINTIMMAIIVFVNLVLSMMEFSRQISIFCTTLISYAIISLLKKIYII